MQVPLTSHLGYRYLKYTLCGISIYQCVTTHYVILPHLPLPRLVDPEGPGIIEAVGEDPRSGITGGDLPSGNGINKIIPHFHYISL